MDHPNTYYMNFWIEYLIMDSNLFESNLNLIKSIDWPSSDDPKLLNEN